MPLSVNFIAHLIADATPDDGDVYTIKVDEELRVRMLDPLSGNPIHLLKFALEYGFLSPEEEAFWSEELLKGAGPVSAENARHQAEFCKTNVRLEIVQPNALQLHSRFHVTIHKYDDSNRFLVFRGVVKAITPVESTK